MNISEQFIKQKKKREVKNNEYDKNITPTSTNFTLFHNNTLFQHTFQRLRNSEQTPGQHIHKKQKKKKKI